MSDKKKVLLEIAHHFGELQGLFARLANEGPAAAQPARTNGQSAAQASAQHKDFDATQLVKTYGEDGELRIKIKGHPFNQYGVPVYEEDFSILGIDLDELKPGSHPFNHRVRAVLKDDGNPRKIIEVLA